MNYKKNSLKKTVVVGTMLVSSAFVFQVSAQTWANPACAPTGCNTPTPINVSGTAQTKAGNFILGGRMEVKNTAPQLWLNENDQTSATLGLWRFLGWNGNLHLYRNLSTTKDFATQSRVISILGANNNIGLGIEPTTKLDVNGQIKIRGGAPGLNKILASDADGLSTWKTKEELGLSGGSSNWDVNGINIFNKNIGNVGIGMNNPTSLLTVQGNSTKLSEVKIIGTNDTTNNSIGLNVDSARNAHVILDRGNTGQTSYVRHATGGTTDWYAGINARQNSDYQISNTFNGEVGQLTIKKSNGNVGIGKNNPVTKLDVLGSGYFSSALGVAGKAIVGGAEIKNTAPELWLNESDETSAGLGLWRFQGWNGNFHLYRNTSAAKDFSTQSRALSILGANNYVGIGIAPTAKLDVDGQVKIRGGAPGLNKILASDADGLSTWKTPAEIGIGGGPWSILGSNIFNNNAGNVGIGTNNPTSALSIERASTGASINVKSSSFNSGITLDKGGARRSSFIAHSSLGSIDWYAGVNGGIDGDNSYKISTDFSSDPLDSQLTLSKSGTLDISGVLRMRGGSPGLNKILASDSSGYSSWKTPAEIGIGSNWNVSGNNISNKNTGNVGVGISNPVTKLHVAGSGFFTGNLDVANNLNIADGDVLIGEAPQGPPTATQPRLEVNGDIRFRTGTPAVNKILAGTDASGSATWKTPAEIGIGSNWNVSGNNISNKNTGNVGIGILSPTEKLHVAGNTRIAGALVSTGDITAMNDMSAGRNMRVGGTLTVVGGNPRPDTILVSTNDSGLAVWKSKTELGIGSSNWNVNGNNISNKNTGSVGVGTNNPNSAAKLHVEGNLKVSNFITAPYINAEAGGFMITPKITITEGEPAPGKVLTATDSGGNATWQTPTGSGLTADKIYTRRSPVGANNDTDIEVACDRSSGDVVLGGGVFYDGKRNGNFWGVAVGTGDMQDGIVGGVGTLIGFSTVKPVTSRPGTASDPYNSSHWYCHADGRTDDTGSLICYARCLDL